MAGKESAGVLVFRNRSQLEILLIHPGGPYWSKKDLGAWSIPKGEPDPGEGRQQCALREMGEELGPAAPQISTPELIELGSIRQKGGKVVHAWAAEGQFDPEKLDSNSFEFEWPPRSGQKREFPEVDRAEWFEPDEARSKINPAQVALLDRLLAALGISGA
jgi:predicted NUDIX family NTP pyrophosphohydrolase